jgi:predicted NBD/HSP70 family sugar kinase
MRELLRQPPGAKAEHRLRILRAIMATSSNQADLVRRSGMSSATVSSVVSELVADGIVQTTRRGQNVMVSMTPTTGIAVGVELGFRNTAVVARRVHQPFTEARVRTLQVGGNNGQQRWLEAAAGLIRDVASDTGSGLDELATIGLGIPRVVHPRTQQLTPPLLPPWESSADPARLITDRVRALAGELGHDLPDELQIRLDNDAALGALAESTYAHKSAEILVYVKASTGVGAGIMISGTVIRGQRGVAGEIGHTTVDRDGRFCLCGGRGCLETVVGSDRLLEQAAVLTRPPRTMNELVERANQGNAVCRRILVEAAARLGRAIGDLCNVLNPNVVVLGGALGRAGDIVLDPCLDGIRESAMAAAHESDFELVLSRVEHATAHGALLMGIDGTAY